MIIYIRVYDNRDRRQEHKFKFLVLSILNLSCAEMCPDEEKGCSARVLVKVVSCRGGDLLSNDIKYVMIG